MSTYKYLVMLKQYEPMSFWRENVIAIVILLRVLARMPWWREQVINFFNFGTGKGLNLLPDRNNCINISGEKQYN